MYDPHYALLAHPTVRARRTADGTGLILKLRTSQATFSLRPVRGRKELYAVIVTPRDLPGLFKNSNMPHLPSPEDREGREHSVRPQWSVFGSFLCERLVGRNAVTRPKSARPLHGNAVLMWPGVSIEERVRCFDYIEKLIRNCIPKILPESGESQRAA